MLDLLQSLWDQMRADLHADSVLPMQEACQALLDGRLGPLTEHQKEDLESVERSLFKLNLRFEGEPIDWNDYSEAAHALRGPLNGTIGFSRLIIKGIDGPTTPTQDQALETIHSTSKRLLALFNLLLDALLLHDQDMSFEIQPVQIDDFLNEMVPIGKTLAEKLDFDFRAEVQVADEVLQSDPKRLKQALSGLMAVAAKYLDGDTLTLRAWSAEDKLYIQLQSARFQLPPSPLADLSRLLTDQASRSFPYDAHLRLGLAWHLLSEIGGQLAYRQNDATCSFTVTLPSA